MAGFPNLTLMAEMFENTAERLRANAALVRTLEEPAQLHELNVVLTRLHELNVASLQGLPFGSLYV